jgi:hypothetical protein
MIATVMVEELRPAARQLGSEEGEAWAEEFTAMARDGYAVLHRRGRRCSTGSATSRRR